MLECPIMFPQRTVWELILRALLSFNWKQLEIKLRVNAALEQSCSERKNEVRERPIEIDDFG